MTPIDLKDRLRESLDLHVNFKEVSYVDWPNYENNGDHFIAAASLKYLRDKNINVSSITSIEKYDFDTPIICQGGGNLGDLFYAHENFRCNLIETNYQNPIVIFPQSIFFENKQKAERSRRIYNAHPDLTILTREQKSYEIAKGLFSKCKVVMCPDVAWYLADWVASITSNQFDSEDTLIRDAHNVNLSIKQREGKHWEHSAFRPNLTKEESVSLAVTLSSISQMSRCSNLMTERLHGHILACMMGITNVLLPVKYHKNESTFETWSKQLPNTIFARMDNGITVF